MKVTITLTNGKTLTADTEPGRAYAKVCRDFVAAQGFTAEGRPRAPVATAVWEAPEVVVSETAGRSSSAEGDSALADRLAAIEARLDRAGL